MDKDLDDASSLTDGDFEAMVLKEAALTMGGSPLPDFVAMPSPCRRRTGIESEDDDEAWCERHQALIQETAQEVKARYADRSRTRDDEGSLSRARDDSLDDLEKWKGSEDEAIDLVSQDLASLLPARTKDDDLFDSTLDTPRAPKVVHLVQKTVGIESPVRHQAAPAYPPSRPYSSPYKYVSPSKNGTRTATTTPSKVSLASAKRSPAKPLLPPKAASPVKPIQTSTIPPPRQRQSFLPRPTNRQQVQKKTSMPT